MTNRDLIITLMLMAGAILLAITLTPRSLAQQSSTAPTATPPKFALLEFIKIEPGKNADYRKDERDVWMPIHRERIKAGAIKSWWQWIVRYPGGSDREYSHVSVDLFDKFEQMEALPAGILKKVHPGIKYADISAQTNAARRQVRTELLRLGDYVQ